MAYRRMPLSKILTRIITWIFSVDFAGVLERRLTNVALNGFKLKLRLTFANFTWLLQLLSWTFYQTNWLFGLLFFSLEFQVLVLVQIFVFIDLNWRIMILNGFLRISLILLKQIVQLRLRVCNNLIVAFQTFVLQRELILVMLFGWTARLALEIRHVIFLIANLVFSLRRNELSIFEIDFHFFKFVVYICFLSRKIIVCTDLNWHFSKFLALFQWLEYNEHVDIRACQKFRCHIFNSFGYWQARRLQNIESKIQILQVIPRVLLTKQFFDLEHFWSRAGYGANYMAQS